MRERKCGIGFYKEWERGLGGMEEEENQKEEKKEARKTGRQTEV